MTQKNDPASLLRLILAMLIFGTIGIFRRWIPMPSALLAFCRGAIGSLSLVLLVLLRRRRVLGRLKRKTLALLVTSGAMIGINWILLFEAYEHTTVAVATLCYYMQPTIVILLTPLIFREALTRKKAVCAAVSVLGMVLVSGVLDGSPNSGDAAGILLGLGAAVLYAAVIITNKTIQGIGAYERTIATLSLNL